MEEAAAAGMAAGIGVGVLIFELALLAFIVITGWKVFEKAGQPGWAMLIPFYNYYIWAKIAGKPGYWVILYLIPLVNIVFAIMTHHGISKAFGKDTGFTVGLVLLGIVFYPILAFGDAQYIGPDGQAAAGDPEVLDQGV